MKTMQVFKCADSKLVVEVLNGDDCDSLTCCGREMVEQQENTVDAAREKHVPVIEASEKGIKVKVGSVPHPMEQKHYIELIEVIHGPCLMRKYLKPGEAPEAEFPIPMQSGLVVREYCNLHGLWKNEV